MARVEAPKSPDYDERVDRVKRDDRISVMAKKSTLTPQERDEALKLLLADYAARQQQSQ